MTKVIVNVSCVSQFVLAMKIPFSVEEFFKVFERYNLSLWPIQIFLYILALVAIIIIFKRSTNSSQIAMSILAFFWGWMGVVYHIFYFSLINKAAYIFGTVFIIQGFVFLYFGVIRKKIQLEFNLNLSGIIALVLLVYSLILYPILGQVMGHTYPMSPTFGVPCPTTIFTFGLLLYSVNRIPWYLFTVPLLWSIVGFSAALNLSVREDFGLAIAGVLSTVVICFYKPKNQTET